MPDSVNIEDFTKLRVCCFLRRVPGGEQWEITRKPRRVGLGSTAQESLLETHSSPIAWERNLAFSRTASAVQTDFLQNCNWTLQAVSQRFGMSSSSSARWQLFAVTWFMQHIASTYLRLKGMLPKGSHSDEQAWFLARPLHLRRVKNTPGKFQDRILLIQFWEWRI